MSKNLQNFMPYLFPLIAVIFVVIMFARWYQGKTAETPVSLLDPQFQVETLSNEAQDSILKGTTDYQTAEMQGEGQVAGEVRYQVEGDKLSFTVTANLPASDEDYAVWLADGSDAKKRVFNLTATKAGYIGSAMVSADVLPVKVVVVKASDLLLQDVLLETDLSKVE
jgi:hypothetical protein